MIPLNAYVYRREELEIAYGYAPIYCYHDLPSGTMVYLHGNKEIGKLPRVSKNYNYQEFFDQEFALMESMRPLDYCI